MEQLLVPKSSWLVLYLSVLSVSCFMVIFLYFQPPAKGAFLRGSGMDQTTGRFTAPITGIYQFSANVHIGKSLQQISLYALSHCTFKSLKGQPLLTVNHPVIPYKVNGQYFFYMKNDGCMIMRQMWITVGLSVTMMVGITTRCYQL